MLPLKGNNPQITSKILTDLSTQRFEPEELDSATRALHALVMILGGGEFGYRTASELSWGSDFEDDEETLYRQGIQLTKSQRFISNIMVILLQDSLVQERCKTILPDLDQESIDAIT